MPSEKLTRILRAKSPFTSEQIAKMTEAEGWAWVYSQPRKQPSAEDMLPQVCFTGFSAAEKEKLTEVAIEFHMQPVHSVTKALSFLVAGDNAGPAKLEKARAQGVPVLTLEEFESILRSDLPPNG